MLVFAGGFRNVFVMLKVVFLGVAVAGLAALGSRPAAAQSLPMELANLREDVRILAQRTGELAMRVEQLERENAELRRQSSGAAQSYATVVQLNEAVAELNRTMRAVAASTRNETLQQVSGQMEKLAKQTNAAIDSLARGMATRATVQTNFTEDFPKEGIPYTVQRGDTLSSIAQKHGASVKDIQNANKIADPRTIQVGQTLFIPGAK
jgi:LysM repeat protein